MGRAIVGNEAAAGPKLGTTNAARVKEAAAYLRVKALTLAPRALGIEAGDDDDVVGLVIDAATSQRITSLTVLLDDSIGLHCSSGVAFAGRVKEEVRWKCADMLQYAQRFAPLAAPASDLGMPRGELVRFYFLTHGGPRVIEISIVDLARIDERLGVLYFAAQRVIAAVTRSCASQTEGEALGLDRAAIDAGDSQCSSVGNAAPLWRT